MRFRFIFLYFSFALLLSGCFQTSAMVGPAITLASTGNIAQAGISYSANKAIEEETGMTATEHFLNSIEENKNKRKKLKKIANIKKDLIILVESNIEKTRNKIINLKDSKLLN